MSGASPASSSGVAPVTTQPSPSASRRTLVAACVGNVVEWYDFAIFGALGVVLVPVFFPSHDRSSVLMAAFAVYATAFVARPVGAVLAGRRGDVRGRRATLASVVIVMSVATACVGLVPSHARIGAAAGAAVVLLRATQGLAAGAELGLAAVFIAEHAPTGSRGLVASWHTATLSLGVALGFAASGVILSVAPDDGFDWWRLPFLVALPLGLVGLYVRRRAVESPSFSRAGADSRAAEPLREVWHDHRPALTAGFALVAAGSLAFNTWFVFLPNHVAATTHVRLEQALLTTVVGLVVTAAAAIGFGRLSDLRGRRPVVLACLAALSLSVVPLWLPATSGSLLAMAAGQAVVGAAVGGCLSVAMLAEMFPTRLRASGLALSAGVATAAFGGTAPIVDLVLVKATGLDLLPAVYVGAAAGVALLVLLRRPETAVTPLA